MSENHLTVGGVTFSGEQLHGNISIRKSNSIVGNELIVDTMTAEVEFLCTMPTLFVPRGSSGLLTSDGKILGVAPYYDVATAEEAQFAYGDTMILSRDDMAGEKFYLSGIDRIGAHRYRLTGVSAFGLLDNSKHPGGVYSGERMSDVIADIIGGAVPYTLAPAFEDEKINGHLPLATRRENLHALLFAMGGTIFKGGDGNMQITSLSMAPNRTIAAESIYLGGEVKRGSRATKLVVLEHQFVALASDKVETLYDGTVEASLITTPLGAVVRGKLTPFSAPAHDLEITGGTIIESGANYAVLSASGYCTLTGKLYTHTTQQIIRGDASASKENEITVDDATLVNPLNSDNVADRLWAYYSRSGQVNVDMVVTDQKPGDKVTFTDPFGEPRTGYIHSMDITPSGILKASAQIITDFSPGATGNNYKRASVFTSATEYHIYDIVGKARIILIGGGQGGYDGEDGEDGEGGTPSGRGAGGKGGNPGEGGVGGKVYIETLTIQPNTVLVVERIGVGGNGNGERGTATSCKLYRYNTQGPTYAFFTSDAGSLRPSGYTDPLTGETYALPGSAGKFPGGDGSGGSSVGNNINGHTPGANGSVPVGVSEIAGGGGGGASSAANGGDGGDAGVIQQSGEILGGDGGTGADGARGRNGGVYLSGGVTAQSYTGSGGGGGDGGGGGGGGGAGTYHISAGDGGAGGKGGRGGRGGMGLIIIHSVR